MYNGIIYNEIIMSTGVSIETYVSSLMHAPKGGFLLVSSLANSLSTLVSA